MKLKLLLLTLFFSALSFGQTTVSYDFSAAGAVTGLNQAAPGIALDANIGFGSFKNSGTSNPAIFSGQLRLYQNATKGGSIIVYASNGVTITDVVVHASGTTGPAAYTVDGGGATNLAAGTTYTMSGLTATSEVEFYQKDGSSSNRIYVDYFEVTYISGVSTYTVTYDGNGNTGGSVPTDANAYNSGDTVTVLGNTGGLTNTGYTFNGWNTANDGSGIAYAASTTFTITANTTLYAQWLLTSPPVITSALTATGVISTAFAYDIVATNTPTSYNATGLPAGLSINTTTGEITGSVATPGTYNVTISATNAYGTDTETLVITITDSPCLSESSFSATPSGWDANSVTYSSGEAVFGSFAGDLTTLALSNPASLTFDLRRTTNTSAKDLIIEVSTTSQTGPFTTVFTYDHSNTTSGSITACTVDLSAYTSFSTVYIRFTKASSTTSPWYLSNVNVFCGTPCTPAVVSVTPTSGPVGTEVTITASSGDLTGSSVSFGGVSASIVSNSATEIVAIVPSGATTGDIIITDSQPCDTSAAFTLITNDRTSCEGSTITDLIIYDIHDEQTGSGGFITLYNGTAATVDMTNYSIWRTSNYNDGNEIDYAALTGTIAPGDLGILKVSVGSCGPASTNGTIDNGFNEDDGIQLRNADGSVVIDDVHTYATGPGYYMVRNAGALSARTSFVAADWSTTPLAAGECYPSAGLVLPDANGNSPSVTLNPVDVNSSCSSTSATLTVSGTEGVAGGFGLTYQWYVNVPGNTGWSAVSNGGVYSGATSTTLNISSTSGLNGYQYYCQIREDAVTCFTATDAAIIKEGATVWDGTTWSNGVPDLMKAATINGNYDTAVNGSFECCSLVVNTGFTLDVQAADYVLIENNLVVDGTLTVHNDGSLVQINDAGVNTGDITYERTTTGNTFDYVYWSSPVDGANAPSGYVYTWATTVANTNGGEGNWVAAGGSSMAAGVGYIMRDVFSRTFTGVARNGIVTPTIQRGTYEGADYAGTNGTTITRFDDNWNLVGNPYPSAISAEDFLLANTNIEGAVRVWTHSTSPSTAINNPFYGTFVANYTPNDYITFNGTGTVSGPAGFNGYIAGGQSFLVNMLDGSTTSETVTFNNALRSTTYDNSQFYRQSNGKIANIGIEKHRIWLDISNANAVSDRTLVGYVAGATEGKDRMFDAVTAVKTSMKIYSIIDEDKMTIQGRVLPFDNKDKVQMGYFAPSNGTYNISIAAVDGLFTGSQDIYLEDKELNVIHDLRQAPYSFYTVAGEDNDRFVLRYTTVALTTDVFTGNENEVTIASAENLIINSANNTIKQVTIHNVLGQLLFNKQVSTSTLQVEGIAKSNQALIVEVVLENNERIIRKVIF